MPERRAILGRNAARLLNIEIPTPQHMLMLGRHSRESGNPGLQGPQRLPWTPASAGATDCGDLTT